MAINHVKRWGYQLQEIKPAAIARTPYDLVVIDYASDSDALPIEHEEEHRRLAEKVVDGGLHSVAVTRASEAPAASSAPSDEPVAQPVPTKR